jgi:serine palmitoyltransferase
MSSSIVEEVSRFINQRNASYLVQSVTEQPKIILSFFETIFLYGLSWMPFTEAYQQWWISLLKEDVEHLFIETTLIIFILYIFLFKKPYDPKKGSDIRNQLTDAEKQMMVDNWKPEPLVPALPDADTANEIGISMPSHEIVIVRQVDATHVTVLAETLDDDGNDTGESVEVDLLDAASFNFLGMTGHPAVAQACIEVLDTYGCGSCGPRGFYGTIDCHLDLESSLAKFLDADEAIIYSDSHSTVASAIPAFAKRTDLLIVDDGVFSAIRTGVTLSRSKVHWFKHNDMDDLRRVCNEIAANDKKKNYRVSPKTQRRYIITEGIFRNSGDFCPLPELIEIKEEHACRLILDESFSFGTVGATGRGVREHFGVDKDSVEIVTASMANSLGSVGGFCAGKRAVVDHQRLEGAGYCYSASAPPFTAKAAQVALELIDADPGMLRQLANNAERINDAVLDIPQLTTSSDPTSPLQHVCVAEGFSSGIRADDLNVLKRMVQHMAVNNQVLAVHAKFVDEGLSSSEASPLDPSIRLTVSAAMSEDQVDEIIKALEDAAQIEFGASSKKKATKKKATKKKATKAKTKKKTKRGKSPSR